MLRDGVEPLTDVDEGVESDASATRCACPFPSFLSSLCELVFVRYGSARLLACVDARSDRRRVCSACPFDVLLLFDVDR